VKVGDLVKCITVGSHGLIMKIDRTPPHREYQQRYWVLLHGKRITFPFLGHQLQVMSEMLTTDNECGNI